jgi:hypothetical protein
MSGFWKFRRPSADGSVQDESALRSIAAILAGWRTPIEQ